MTDETKKLTKEYTLKRPIKGDGEAGETLTSVTLTELDLSDLAIAERITASNGGGSIENTIQLIVLSTGLSVKTVKRIKMADIKGLGDALEGFTTGYDSAVGDSPNT